MMHRVSAAFAYFLIVYACGFAIGVVREFFVTPRTGLTLALWIELPVMIGASFMASRLVLGRFAGKAGLSDRAVIGAFALVLLVLAEEAMSWALRGVSVFTIWAHFSLLAGIANFTGLLIFALMPLLIDVRKRDVARQ